MSEKRMSALALTFPSLRRADGIAPFDAGKLEKWAVGPVPSTGALHAARFVLSVWNAQHAWACGPFEVTRAVMTWDAGHVEAFATWARDPWLA